jgi:nucleoside-diphosphate-sugar epimerase
MKRVLVTGSTGYLGSVLTPYLQENGFECIGYDTGFFRDCTLYDPKETITIQKDVRKLEESDLKDIDALIQLAGISNDPFGKLKPENIYDPTREYSLRIAKLCKKKGIKFIFSSSCSVYGIGKEGLVNEESETNPQTPYSLNKLQVEQDLKQISDRDFSPICLRLATVFGPSPRLRFDLVINMLVGMVLTTGKIVLNSDGKAWRPHVHILDVCKAFKKSLDLEYDEGTSLILNVGDVKNNCQVIDIANMIKDRIKGCTINFLNNDPNLDKTGLIKDKKIQDGVDTRTYRVSFDKISRYLDNFKCDWNLEKGIANLIEVLDDIKLSDVQFKNFNFYRLQKLENLHRQKLISDDLFWIVNRNN